MSNITEVLGTLLTTDGAMGAALVDSDSGMVLGTAGSGIDLDVAAAGNTEVMRAMLKTMKALSLSNESIDDILITLSSQYHILRPMATNSAVFLYLVLAKSKSNLALARINVKTADGALKL